jgi:hypothetical protein
MIDRKLSQKIRAAILDQKNHAKKVRFRDGEILVYGTLPNTNKNGWYFLGYIIDAEIKGLSGIGLKE